MPTVIRDSKWFMWIPFKLLFGKKAHYFFDFKTILGNITQEELLNIYRETSDVHLSRETDLNKGCEEKILKEVEGKTVLEVGFGTGYLIKKIEKKYKVTGVDFNVDEMVTFSNPETKIIECSATDLPFEDNSFDTVICTHTLEHILNINDAVNELKRVCKQKLIIVVPMQRPYKYTFDLHIHFFPYKSLFENFMRNFEKKPERKYIEPIQGDIYYHEEYQN
ncbi:MAG: methyltransferase domain-containing protein [Marinicella sp.]